MPKILEHASKARTSGIKLKGVEFAEKLSTALLERAREMEELYMRFQNRTMAEKKDAKDYAELNKEWDSKSAWFDKAQARPDYCWSCAIYLP